MMADMMESIEAVENRLRQEMHIALEKHKTVLEQEAKRKAALDAKIINGSADLPKELRMSKGGINTYEVQDLILLKHSISQKFDQ
jgi:hypothetical protein